MIGISVKERGCYFRGQWDEEIVGTTDVDALGTILPKSYKHLRPLSTKILNHILHPDKYHSPKTISS